MSESKRLTKVGIQKIEGRLDNSIFTKYSFKATYNQNENKIVHIVFKDNNSFYFSIKRSKSKERWEVIERPGQYLDIETKSVHSDFSRCINNLNAWVDRIQNEVTYQDTKDWSSVVNIRKMTEEKVRGMENPEVPYKGEEAEEMKDQIKTVIENVEILKEEKKELRRELNILKNDLNKLNDQIESIPRKTWLRSVMGSTTKFFESAAKKNFFSKKDAGKPFKGLLPGIDKADEEKSKKLKGEGKTSSKN